MLMIIVFIVKATPCMCFMFHILWMGACSPVHRDTRITGGQEDLSVTNIAHET